MINYFEKEKKNVKKVNLKAFGFLTVLILLDFIYIKLKIKRPKFSKF